MTHFFKFSLIVSFLANSLFAEAAKPNILFILSDDQALETLSIMGELECKTPHLDKLAEEGVLFTRAYNMGAWSGAVCMASRAMFNSGAFVNRANQTVRKQPQWAQIMHGAGYKTYMTGKWHVPGKTAKNPPFDVVKDVRGGMPSQTEAGINRPLSPEDYEKGWKPWDKKHGGFWEGGKHWTEVTAGNAIEFLADVKTIDKPFFMYVAFNAPHDPRQAPKEYVDMYPLENISLPKSHQGLYPYRNQIGCGKQLRDAAIMPFPRTEYATKINRQEYFASTTHMDHNIGRVLKALKESGKADNTYIIFTSDHGLAVGEHGLVGKQNMYEHSMRAPFIIVGPDIPKGERNETAIYIQDAMATSLDLGKIAKPEYVEFKSLLALIEGDKSPHYPVIFGKYINYQRMILKDQWKLIVYPYAKKYRLFNLEKDPKEMKDLSDNAEYKAVLESLKLELKELQVQMGEEFDFENPPPIDYAALKKFKKKSH
ncbi:sulfatase-like hydrolase/transferase [Lentisphaera profundi]|uniref:Sulfatase-like hydrolase/transferase n=1 Tax=Lentisphaera profundi TaxID=1658616 RepID=A0ABY7VUK0_9BACT|nr:sulfatase-like hydrolase/transferase [Lentisphaera profundi]WDE96567.1 sulfatase-like hydrolase/transferase [Lentisphaera profundi]